MTERPGANLSTFQIWLDMLLTVMTLIVTGPHLVYTSMGRNKEIGCVDIVCVRTIPDMYIKKKKWGEHILFAEIKSLIHSMYIFLTYIVC